MKTIKAFLIGTLVAFIGLSAWAATASFSGTLNLCKGDVFNYYESHGSSYKYTQKSNSDSTVAKGTGTSSARQSGKFFSIEALKAGKTTVVFNFQKSSGGTTYTATMTVNVSDERVIEPGKTATVEGWGNSNEPGSSTWSSSDITPSGLVTVKIDSGSKSAMKATLTAGKTADSGTVTIRNVSGNSGSEYIYAARVTDPRTPIAVPTAAQNLVYGWTNQVGVAAGEGYVRGGIYEASAAGEYAATVTPDDGHCWPDFTRDTKEIKWSIAYRAATVTVIDTNKVSGAEEPIYRTRNENFIADDPTELVWTAWRTNTSEEVGTYDIVVLGETHQGGYEITYVGGKLEIVNAPVGPSIPEDEGEIEYNPETKVVVVKPDQGVTEVEIINMPADGTVKVPVSVGTIRGVEAGQVVEVFYTAPAGAGGRTYDITSAFTISGEKESGVAIELNETTSVTFDLGDGKTETITVTPMLTDVGDETVEPLEVLTEEVDVGVKTIPGLTYALKRSDEPGTVRAGKVVNEKQAEGLRTKLKDPMDGGKPEKALYIIEVKK